MNKRGLIGKLFIIIIGVILLIGAIIGITVYQAYSLAKLVQQEQINIESSVDSLKKGDCSKLSELETSINKIKDNSKSACMNPIIKIAVEKMSQIPIKCGNLSSLDQQIETSLAEIKGACANLTAANMTISNN